MLTSCERYRDAENLQQQARIGLCALRATRPAPYFLSLACSWNPFGPWPMASSGHTCAY